MMPPHDSMSLDNEREAIKTRAEEGEEKVREAKTTRVKKETGESYEEDIVMASATEPLSRPSGPSVAPSVHRSVSSCHRELLLIEICFIWLYRVVKQSRLRAR